MQYAVGDKPDRAMFGTSFRYDIVIVNRRVIIEVYGAQHFRQVSNWGSPEDTQKNDIVKEKLAVKHGYRVIRISQEYVYSQIPQNKTDWIISLKEAIERADRVPLQFISDRDEYKDRWPVQ